MAAMPAADNPQRIILREAAAALGSSWKMFTSKVLQVCLLNHQIAVIARVSTLQVIGVGGIEM
jgi:hypothetical protein